MYFTSMHLINKNEAYFASYLSITLYQFKHKIMIINIFTQNMKINSELIETFWSKF